jgi:hypothetical protein
MHELGYEQRSSSQVCLLDVLGRNVFLTKSQLSKSVLDVCAIRPLKSRQTCINSFLAQWTDKIEKKKLSTGEIAYRRYPGR